ncbi:MAG: histidine phosphatase family protein [Gammaproteobacteria bacterium]|nr:histidine phosphatase family protein [Gammaproteobacteria bacterium]
MKLIRILLLALLAGPAGIIVAPPLSAASGEAQLWQALRSGEAAALMRHALAPGTGDPGNFDIDNCATQRNLSERGREQARATGERFRRNGIQRAQVYSSRWCRCQETARLMALGDVRSFAGLNSFFRDRSTEPGQSAATLALIEEHIAAGGTPLVLVTHQVNITALTDVFPGSGEIIVVKPGADGLQVVGRIDNP